MPQYLVICVNSQFQSHPIGDKASIRLNIHRTRRQPMVRHRPCSRGRAFDNVKPVHQRRLVFMSSPARGKIVQPTDMARSGVEEIRVQRQNHVGLFQVVLRLDDFAESQLRSGPGIFAVHRVMDVPDHCGKGIFEVCQLLRQRWRRDSVREHAQTPSPGGVGPAPAQFLENRGQKRIPGAILAKMRH